ncbi:hypothetical protein [Mesorhizobium sp. M0870]|uniref:hypothetical protein n=1 Tax=Mesorhizobium sp. M0870 TaxID=2957016 RepID=UPI003338C4A1
MSEKPAAGQALLTARKLIQGKLHDIEMSIRGIPCGFGLNVGPTTRRTYAARIGELIEGHPTLEAIAASRLKVRDALTNEFAGFERKDARHGPWPVRTTIHVDS